MEASKRAAASWALRMGASLVILAFGCEASFFRRVVLRLAFILRNVTAALAAATGVNGVAQTASSMAALRLPRCGRRVEFLLLATRFQGSRRRRPPWLLQRVPKLPPARANSGGARHGTGRGPGNMWGRGEVWAGGEEWWRIIGPLPGLLVSYSASQPNQNKS